LTKASPYVLIIMRITINKGEERCLALGGEETLKNVVIE